MLLYFCGLFGKIFEWVLFFFTISLIWFVNQFFDGLFVYTTVTTAENGPKALELLGLSSGGQNTLNGVSFFFLR
jgi:uncharacterized membrane protein YphA (DoxX/SURF4 family)